MDHTTILIAIGALFILGLALEKFGRIVHVPRVTLLMLLGALLGPPGLDLLPEHIGTTEGIYAPTALTMVAFLLGGELKRDTLRAHGKQILTLSLSVVSVSVILVGGGLWLAGMPLALALVLGAISVATAPAATRDVVIQSGHKGRFAKTVLGVVAIDDLWGLLVFSIVLAIVGGLNGGGVSGGLMFGLWDIGGAVVLGLGLGIPAAFLTGRLKPGEPTLLEAVGLVLLVAGLALYLNVSFLLAGIVCGATVVNLAHHHERPFHEIERIEWPFLLLFFVIAGASLELDQITRFGQVAAGYIGLRFLARLVAGWIGGNLAGLPARQARLVGLAFMPQAGVAIGIAIVAGEQLPEFADQILAITIASTIVFELFGPFFTQFALDHARREGS